MARPRREAPKSTTRKLAMALRPPRLSVYVLVQLLGPVAVLTLLLTSVIWLINILPLLDLVINRGQSALTFIYLILLVMPTPLVFIMPIAFFVAVMITLQRLRGDSELLVMASAGYSLCQLAMPVLAAGAIVMALTYACTLYLAPAGQRALSDRLGDIRADMAGALLKVGEFNPLSPGLTVFIRQLNNSGEMHGILVHNSHDPLRPVTYIAERGILARTPAGPRLIMLDGMIETGAQNGKQLQVLNFARDTIDLEQFSNPAQFTLRKANERLLGELLWPSERNLDQRIRDQFFAEAHNRLSEPLYCIAFALIALAAVTRGRRQRDRVALRLAVASLVAIALRIAGYGIIGLAQRNPPLVSLFYMLPALGAIGAVIILSGYSPAWLTARFQVHPA
jgi:lipopolysaccharide export system permease protein